MLTVRPPSSAPNTWRGFFIQIATITVGLLVAFGLDAGGEYLHHRHQVTQTRQALQREHDFNVKLYAVKTEEFERMTPILQTDLAIFLYLQKHPGTPETDLPGKLSFYNLTIVHIDAAWKTAQQNDVIGLMPAAEVQRDADLYHRLQIVTDAAIAFRSALYEARSFTLIDPDPAHLTPAQIDHQIDLTRVLLLDHVLLGGAQRTLAGRFPEFSAPPQQEITKLLHVSPSSDDPALLLLQKKTAQIMAEADVK